MENNINTNLETNHVVDFSDRLYKLAMAVIILVGLFLVGYLVYQFKALPQNMPREVMVSGEGKAYVKPDIAQATFGVTAQAPKSQDAVNQSNSKMNAIIAAIKGLGVEDKDIQTTGYNVSPVYGYDRGGVTPMDVKSGSAASPMYYPTTGNPVIIGYSLDQRVSVKIRNFDNINAILDKATASGATNVGDLQFTVDNPEQARSEARSKAIDQAKEKMKNLAKESGLALGRLVNISEGYNSYPQPYGLGGAAFDNKAVMVTPEVQTGQMEVNTTVTLTYQVR